jgi:glycosyltransferase involved in cell wall biosynthesis
VSTRATEPSYLDRPRLEVSAAAAAVDDDIELLVPDDDVRSPELSIVIPALNERLTITEFISWCWAGLHQAGIVGEILIVDSSSDETPQLALEAGARVLRTPKRGLGRAYKDAIPFIRGNYVIMGDADCTYDFRELKPFVDRFREGFEYVMGSRWRGSIEPGAMPRLHQYLGTPVTTWILNRLYGCHFTDIHCGMRGITRDALIRMDLDSDSWEYASEMVLKTVHLGLRTSEVPVRFLKDIDGRLSHHKRAGWRSPWSAAWINLRSMFVYGSDFFLLKPGLVLFVIGLAWTLPLSGGPITIGQLTFSLYWMLVGVTAAVVGLQSFFLGVVAQVLFDYQGRARRRWLALFPYTRSVIAAGVIVALGIACAVPLLVYYIGHHGHLSLTAQTQDGLAVTGLLLTIIGASLFSFTLVLHATAIATRRSSARVRRTS